MNPSVSYSPPSSLPSSPSISQLLPSPPATSPTPSADSPLPSAFGSGDRADSPLPEFGHLPPSPIHSSPAISPLPPARRSSAPSSYYSQETAARFEALLVRAELPPPRPTPARHQGGARARQDREMGTASGQHAGPVATAGPPQAERRFHQPGHRHHRQMLHHHQLLNGASLPPLTHGCEDHWSWNKNDKSHEVRLYGPKQRIAHFHPNWSNGTAGVRGTRVLNGGRYYWEINVSQRIFGTSMMFGIGTKKARLHVDAFVNMLGEDENSWGLSHKGLLWHGGQHKQYIKCFKENIATTIGIYFDGISGTLTYYKDNVCLGVAFSGLNQVSEPLYPIVCSTAAKTEMALGVLKRDFVNLQDRCRAVILKHLTHEEQIDQLCLPLRIKQYISEGLENFQEDVALYVNNQMTHW